MDGLTHRPGSKTVKVFVTFCMLRANIERATLSLAFPCAIALTFDRSLLVNSFRWSVNMMKHLAKARSCKADLVLLQPFLRFSLKNGSLFKAEI